MNDVLRQRILRKLDTLSDERVYQILDYIEFLESKYGARQPAASVFQRFAESVEDTMRAGRVSAATIAETMNLMSKAMGVLSGALAAGKSVATDVMSAATRPGAPPAASPGASPSAPAQTLSPTQTPTPAPPPSSAPSVSAPPDSSGASSTSQSGELVP
jgi:hypothetical protein